MVKLLAGTDEAAPLRGCYVLEMRVQSDQPGM